MNEKKLFRFSIALSGPLKFSPEIICEVYERWVLETGYEELPFEATQSLIEFEVPERAVDGLRTWLLALLAEPAAYDVEPRCAVEEAVGSEAMIQ
jgi:hypothetical protein